MHPTCLIGPCRSSFCLSAARRTWLSSLSLSLKVLADNGADVYLNGVKLVADSASNHDVLYWNNVVTVLGSSANIKQGASPAMSVTSGFTGSLFCCACKLCQLAAVAID